MNWLMNGLKNLLQVLTKQQQSSSPPVKRVRHRVTWIGPDPEKTMRVVNSLYGVKRYGVNVLLRAEGPMAMDVASRADAKPDEYLLTATVLHVGRSSSQAWEMRAARGTQIPNDRTDILVVVWPQEWLGRIDDLAKDRRQDVATAIGAKRAQGTLRRVAFLIPDMPGDFAARPAEQCGVQADRRRLFGEALKQGLRESRDRCGDPMADPSWRQWVERNILGDTGLHQMIDTAAAVTRHESPLFLATAGGPGLSFVLSWIRRPPKPRVRVRRVAAAAAACAAVWLGLATLFAVAPRLPSPAPVVVTDSVQVMLRTASKRIEGYQSWFGLTAAIASTNLDSLERAYDLLKFRDDVSAEVARVEAQLEAIEANGDTLAIARPQRLAQARELIRVENKALQVWPERAKTKGNSDELLEPWRREVARAYLDVAFLASKPRQSVLRGFDTDSLSTYQLGLEHLGFGDWSQLLADLQAKTSGLEYYRLWLQARDASPQSRLLLRVNRVVPRLWPQASDLTSTGYTNWKDIKCGLGDHAQEFMRGPKAAALLAKPCGGEPRPLTVVFTTTTPGPWHLDVKVQGENVWRAVLPSGPTTCPLKIPAGFPGMSLSLALVLGHAAHSPLNGIILSRCTSGPTVAIALSMSGGDVPFPDGSTIHYQVMADENAGLSQ
jgi:hypothetical protein